MGADRRARGEQLLGQHIALEEALLLAAVFFGPGNADPAARAEAAAELRRMTLAEVAARAPAAGGLLLDEKGAHILAQRLAFGRQGERIEAKDPGHGLPPPVFGHFSGS